MRRGLLEHRSHGGAIDEVSSAVSFRPDVVHPPGTVAAPWAYRDGVADPDAAAHAACFVGDELWAQTHGCVWRLAPHREPRLLRVTNTLTLVRTQGPWVEFRSERGWDRSPGDSDTRGVHLFSLDADAWYEGPWPQGLSCWFREGVEPEDFVLVDPFGGRALDVACLDRHLPPVYDAGSRIASIDGRVVDLAAGVVSSWPDAIEATWSRSLVELFPQELRIFSDPHDPEPLEVCLAEAIAKAPDGAMWWVVSAREQRRCGLLGVDDRALWAISTHWRAAAFDSGVRRLALVSPRRALVLDTGDLWAPPLLDFSFPWPWSDPFAAQDERLLSEGLRARQGEYRRSFATWLDADAAARAAAAARNPLPQQEPVSVSEEFIEDDPYGDEEIPF